MRPIIKVENLSKQYRIGARQAAYSTLRDSITETLRAPFGWLRRNGNHEDNTIWALKDVSFEVMPGEVVGVIGRNGAGKSTLLKILSRITEPTTGQVDLYGRVGSLLEVGTGFHQELSGRENIYLNGAILGMGRSEIARKFDEIVAFAEIENFIDTPVKHYSSGMYMRLAFAVAAHLETEIIMMENPKVGACGGKIEAVCEVEPPSWFNRYTENFAVGNQGEVSGDVTFTRGYLWGAGLCIRKDAWDCLEHVGFKSLLVDRKGKQLSSGGDTERCFALRLAGWRLWYDERLSLRHCISSDRLTWSYLRKLYRGFGASTVGLDCYNNIMFQSRLSRRQRLRQAWQWQAVGTLKLLLKQLMDAWTVGKSCEGSPQLLKLDWTWGRLIELLKKRNDYNENIRKVRGWKSRLELR